MIPSYSTACLDWEKRIVAGQSLVPFAPLFQNEASAALDIFRDLILVDVSGKPTIGEACREWVFDFVGAVFGSYDAESGRRLVNDFFLLVSKKNSKSTTAAGIMVTALIRNWRDSAEFLILAPTKEAADNAYKPARDMIKADPELDRLLHIQEGTRTITHRITKAVLKVVAADTQTVSGKKAVGIFIDELWEFGKRSGAENMLREATGGMASRPEGFVIYASTQSDEPPAGVFKQKLDYFRNVRDGLIQRPRSLGVIYEFPRRMIEDETYRKPENFYVTNPNMGLSVDEGFLIDEMEKAEIAGPESVRGFLAKHLNVEIGLALRAGRWAGADSWEAAAAQNLTLDLLLDVCEVVVVGIDCGGLDDLLGLTVMGRHKQTRSWMSWSHGWVTYKQLERRKIEAPRLRDFEKQKDLTFVETTFEAAAQVVDIIERCVKAQKTPEADAVGLDPVGAKQIVDELVARGHNEPFYRGVRQGWELASAIRTTERALEDGVIFHADQPIMDWCVSNAKVEQKGNAVVVTKQAAGAAKIDLLLSWFDAAALMSLSPVAKVPRKPRVFVI